MFSSKIVGTMLPNTAPYPYITLSAQYAVIPA